MGWASGTWGGGQSKYVKLRQTPERKDHFEGAGIDGRIPLN